MPPPKIQLYKPPQAFHRFTLKRKQVFLAQLAKGVSIAAAARAAGVSRRTAYDHQEADPEFAKAWKDAYEEGSDTWEDQLLVNAQRRHSDVACIFTLKARRPAIYNPPQRQLLGGDPDAPPVAVRTEISDLTDDEIRRELAELRALKDARARIGGLAAPVPGRSNGVGDGESESI